MSEKEVEREPANGAPEMDQETYKLVQELFQLVRAGDAARLRNLLGMGLVPNLRDGKGNSLLMLASYNGQHETARALLEHGGDAELENERGQKPLAGAAFKGDVEMARLLLEHGADANARGSLDGKTALMFAAMFDRVEIIELLLERNADLQARDNNGATALDAARVMGALKAVARLEQKQK